METNSKVSIKENVAHFIQKFRVFLIAFLALIAAGIIAAAVYQEISKVNSAAMTKVIEELDAAYESTKTAKTDQEKLDSQKIFEENFAKIEKSFPGSYAAQRGNFYQGNLKYESKDFGSAEAAFSKAALEMETSYLAPIALMNAAIAAEENANLAKAVEYLTTLSKKYSKNSPLAIRALFNLGRIAEIQKNWTSAKEAYQKLLDSYGSSSWTKLARDRIIYLKAQGLL